jgi:hypothetical protein
MERNILMQYKVRTDIHAGATTYPDMSGVCNTATTPPSTGTTYPDMSGVCYGTTPPPPPPPPTGATYPDMSGVC